MSCVLFTANVPHLFALLLEFVEVVVFFHRALKHAISFHGKRLTSRDESQNKTTEQRVRVVCRASFEGEQPYRDISTDMAKKSKLPDNSAEYIELSVRPRQLRFVRGSVVFSFCVEPLLPKRWKATRQSTMTGRYAGNRRQDRKHFSAGRFK